MSAVMPADDVTVTIELGGAGGGEGVKGDGTRLLPPSSRRWPSGRAWLFAVASFVAVATGLILWLGADDCYARGRELDAANRTAVDCARFAGNRSVILLVAGQSNAANFGAFGDEGPPPPASGAIGNLNIFDGECYVAQPPLLGADGGLDSPWVRLAGHLLASGAADSVLLVPIAVGSTTIQRWARGACRPRFDYAADALEQHGLAASLVLWHQGESDARSSRVSTYASMFFEMHASVRRRVRARWVVAQATWCGDADRGDAELRRVQAQLPAALPGHVWPGPNTDRLNGSAMRRDECHMTSDGLDAAARLWASSVLSALPAGNESFAE